MALRDIILFFRKKEVNKELHLKLSSLESNIRELEKTISILQEHHQKENTKNSNDPPIIIEKINIEKIILDKYELNNNFGQLGIKELKGKLNIGATYGTEFTPSFPEKDSAETNRNEKKNESVKEKGPKVTIKAKREEP